VQEVMDAVQSLHKRYPRRRCSVSGAPASAGRPAAFIHVEAAHGKINTPLHSGRELSGIRELATFGAEKSKCWWVSPRGGTQQQVLRSGISTSSHPRRPM